MQSVDIIIIGAGMAGASAAYFLAPQRRVLLLEREAQPGYHATGRSAAMYVETYGNAPVRALTSAGKSFFLQPPPGFAEQPLLTPRGALVVGGEAERGHLRQQLEDLRALVPSVTWWEREQILACVPVLRPEHAACAVYEPEAMDMDVHAIHQGFLRGAKGHGAQLRCDAEVLRLQPGADGWRVETRQGAWQAPVVVNAAGAWCDAIAALAGVAPVGLQPMRRTAFTFDAPTQLDTRAWPLVIDAQERFYFKPDAGVLLGSPANADPVPPQDVQPDEMDVAIGVDRLQQATTLPIRRLRHTWAGLRSFVADKTPVCGMDAHAPGFFWLAGQGGYGIQTAPGLGQLTAALLLGQPLPAELHRCGVKPAQLAPRLLPTKADAACGCS